MINAVNIPVEVVAAGQNILFAANRIKTNCAAIRHDAGSGLFAITKAGLYRISFTANALATVAAQDVQLAIETDGETILAALSRDTITTAGTYRSIALDIPVRVPCGCCVSISVCNRAATAVTLENSNIIIERIG